MTDNRTTDELDVMRVVTDALNQVDIEGRERILKYVSDFFGLDVYNGPRPTASQQSIIVNTSTDDRKLNFADRETISPKDFLHEKQPRTDIERVACLGYYLAEYRDTPRFKTGDISKLNTEAAQLKFSNAAAAVSNAAGSALLVPAGKGTKQLSALGERFVDALPDHEDAKAVLGRMRPRRGRKKSSNTKKARKATK